MSFSRHKKIYQSDGTKRRRNRPLRLPGDHRSDESSAGYSFLGCSPNSAHVRFAGRNQLLALSCCCKLFS